MKRFIVVLMCILVASIALADTRTMNGDNYGGSYEIAWSALSTVTNTTAYTLPFYANKAFCEFVVTGTNTDREVTLQTKLTTNSTFYNTTSEHTLTPNDLDTQAFDVVEKGMKDVRVHIVNTSTMGASNTVTATCRFYR